jgi:hypothetical protein
LPAGRRRAEPEETGHQLLAAFRCEPIPERAAGFYADLKVTRQQRGLSLDENDLSVAATALALGASLVSRDSDFAAITGLSVVALNKFGSDPELPEMVVDMFVHQNRPLLRRHLPKETMRIVRTPRRPSRRKLVNQFR